MNLRGSSSLTAYQQDIWAGNSLFPDLPQFNCFITDRFTGEVDVDLLKECLRRAADRNDAFQLRIDPEDGTPRQWVEHEAFDIPTIDLSGTAAPRAACETWIKDAFDVPFEVERRRLFEIAILKEREDVVHAYVKVHHIVADAWGLNLFMSQVRAEYDQVRRTGRFDDRPAPSYLDFVEDERRYRGSDDHERDRAFFQEQLEGVAPAFFRRAAPAGSRRSARHGFLIERGLIDRIRERGDSVFAFVASAFAVYLSRIHGTDEVVLGVPLLNRPTAGQKRTVGHFANTLPLRVTPGGDRTMTELVAEVQAATRALKPHERYSLGDLLRSVPLQGSGPKRLFDTTIAYLRWPTPLDVQDVAYETVVQARAHDDDVLAVVVNELDDVSDVLVDMDYALDVFDADFPIESVATHIEAILRGTLAGADRPLSEVPMISATERAALVAAGSGPVTDYSQDTTLHALFERQAARTPDRLAVVADDPAESLTFAQLDAWANHIAHQLRGDGVGAGDRVAVVAERSPQLVAAVLGVLKAGGAYVPVDPGHPAERVRFLLADSGAKSVLLGGTVSGSLVGDAVPVRHLDATARVASAPPVPVSGPRDLAYVIYTSGSTGRPKGVQVEHRSVVNRLEWMQRRYPVGGGDVLLQKTPVTFDVSVWELFWWASTGAGLALLPPRGERDPGVILGTVEAHRVSVAHFVPSMLGPFLDLLEEDPALLDRIASLRLVFCSGEALTPAQVNRFNRVFAAAGATAPRLVNLYGPTEATVDVTYHDCPGDTAEAVRRVPIGRPIDNVRLYVVGAYGDLQPTGVPGELCVAGVCVARGYLGRPELDSAAFVADPFTPGTEVPPGEGRGRMYRTGDRARWLADGTLEYLGRLDDQVKIRGNRVELGEVRDRLAAFPGVRDAIVVDRNSPARGVHLVGYYVADEDVRPADLRARLLDSLPEFMIPAFFVRIDRIPLTANGKADRRRLPAPAVEADARNAEPTNEIEAKIAAAWSVVLETDGIGVDQDYYSLGGDSIMMLRIQAEARRAGVHFTLADMVRNPTVAALAATATTSTPDGQDTPLEPFALVSGVDRARLTGLADAYPATRLHLGLLYHSREHEKTAVYHDVFRYSLKTVWDEAALRRAFDSLVRRHPVLRSAFDLGGYSEPLQLVHQEVDGGLEITDLRDLGDREAQAEVARHIEERRYHEYRLDRPPLYLFRAHVLNGSVELVFSFHHAILDGWSVATLVRELLQDFLHNAGQPVAAVPSGPLPSPALYVREERRALASDSTRRYWQRLLAGSELVQIDGFRPYEPAGDEGLIVHHVELPDGLGTEVRDLARAHGLPVKSLLLAAHCLTLRLFSDTQDITTGLVTGGRPEEAGAERITGLFLETLPLRLDTRPRTWLDSAREVYRQERDSHPHRRYPLSAIQEDRGGDVVFETAFNYVHLHVLSSLFEDTDMALTDFRTWEETNFKLLVNAVVDPMDDRLWLRMDCDGRTFSRSQAESLGRTYLAVLQRMTEQPDADVDFAFLRDPRDEALLRAGSTPGTGADTPLNVIRRIDEHVARTPDAVAVSCGPRQWTYARLDEAANRIARGLIGAGARPGATVGIAMDRSPETLATVLGVGKAGATCVPLDVSYPPARLAAMVAQADPLRIITHETHAHLFEDSSRLLRVDDLLAAEPEPGGGPELPEITGETVAYLLFTSGSSGEPKGVELPHRVLANYMRWQIPSASGAAGGKTLQFAPLSFDVAFQEIYSTLCGGGTLQLLSEEERRDMPALLRLLDREEVERVFMPYVALQQLAETSQALGIRPRALRVVISSGEQLRITDEIRRFCAALPGTVLENQYGPTETHLLTHHTMTGDPDGFPDLPPIGTPIDGIEIHLLDGLMRPVPPGAKGEVYVGGVCLAHGYRNRPDLTEQRFVPHPSGQPGARLYRTGDLARVMPDGNLVWLGRADSQVKVRGFRVELAEVELAIAKLAEEQPGIREAAVVARRREGADAFLAAFLVGDAEAVELDEVRTRLRTVLPDYMVPSHLEWLPRLPLTPSGKRDDALLRRMPLSAPTTDATPPGDEYEKALVGILSELLGLPTLGVRDNFFDIGGTSLTAMRLVMTIEKRYGVSVPLSAFVAAPTVSGLAERLRAGGPAAEFDPVVPIRTQGDKPPLFLVHPLGGHVLCYVRLARHLPEDQPVYALQAAGTVPGTEPLSSIPELADSYLKAMRRACPEGPYVIGGWSFGGFIAFEMARQLRSADPAALQGTVLIDPIFVKQGERPDVADHSLLEWFFWELLWTGSDGTAPVIALPDGLDEEAKFDFIVEHATRAGVLPTGSSRTTVRRLFGMFKAHWRAILSYRPETGDEDLVLLRATSELPEILRPMHQAARSLHEDPTNGWGALTTGRVRTVDVPGDHLVLLEEPHVNVVAQRVAEAVTGRLDQRPVERSGK
ncbi:non-ribosomal peptide synthetase [Streptomyces sp. FH025]|uniref:amino acid adenylation domain-containing protein n=1 Tax=Streptomyces sp. FH025 TaxID=2815937 RepID=UPI001A9D0E9D|nr:non-ribosomal peptide synthetase [Streptomyces sp. FH025]MBO1414063.1 amino acid adenylation domain-containing protein [Streptomyces sp. FH025]